MRFRTLLLPAALAFFLFPGAANAGPCDAHFTFDGNIADASGNGYDGLLIGTGGEAVPGAPQFGEGLSGQALKLDGSSAVRAPLDLSAEGCPQVTISAWVKFEDNPTKGFQYILSSGRGGPALIREGVNLNVNGGGQRHRATKALRGGSWEFIAGTIDYNAGKMTVHWRNRTFEKDIGTSGTKDADIWIGAVGDDLRMPVQAGLIDDVRVVGQILTADQIKNLSQNTGHTGRPPMPYGGPYGSPPGPGADQSNPDAAGRIAEHSNGIDVGAGVPETAGGGPWGGNPYIDGEAAVDEVPGQPGVYQTPEDQAVVVNHEEQYSVPDTPPGGVEDRTGDGGSTSGSSLIHEPGQPAPSVLQGDGGSSTVFPGGRDLSSGTIDDLQQARDENATPEIT